jgi:uncharacterized protein with HEPN domain
MDNRDKKLLFDIKVSIENIERYIGPAKVFESYRKNDMLKDAVVRNLEIIGEAVSRLLKLNPAIVLTNARRIVDTRNKIIHSYDDIEDVNIWAIVVNHLPLLKIEVDSLLQNK